MNNDELTTTIIHEISTKIESLSSRVERIKKDITHLASDAVELSIYMDMAKKICIHDLSKSLQISPKELTSLKKSCRLTRNSPVLNRALLVRFGIIY
jgi:hypothetical protein